MNYTNFNNVKCKVYYPSTFKKVWYNVGKGKYFQLTLIVALAGLLKCRWETLLAYPDYFSHLRSKMSYLRVYDAGSLSCLQFLWTDTTLRGVAAPQASVPDQLLGLTLPFKRYYEYEYLFECKGHIINIIRNKSYSRTRDLQSWCRIISQLVTIGHCSSLLCSNSPTAPRQMFASNQESKRFNQQRHMRKLWATHDVS